MSLLALLHVAALPLLTLAAPTARITPASPEARAVFAGGCFWCMETAYEGIPGVKAVVSGFAGGSEKNPTYEDVSAGRTGHLEAVQVTYDPSVISYARLVDVFWRNVDPTQADGQFCDLGKQYRSAVFYSTPAEKAIAERTRAAAAATLRRPIDTRILPAGAFYPAEEYHQDFYKKNPARYSSYRKGCRRDAQLQKLWGRAPTTAH